MRREDFSSEEAYNAYLEQREDMSKNILIQIFNYSLRLPRGSKFRGNLTKDKPA
jgi:hypothetical protein